MKITLASGSPTRLKLLKQMHINADEVINTDIDESIQPKEKVVHYVQRLSIGKANKAREITQLKDTYIIAADTVAYCSRQIIGKPKSKEDAFKYIKNLSGKKHRVYTGVTVISSCGKISTNYSMSILTIKNMSDKEIHFYIDKEEYKGCAGGYSIGGYWDAYVKRINGSYSNIQGLPLHLTRNMLVGLGYYC